MTFSPPPTLTSQRAHEIYVPAFTRIIEYAHWAMVEGEVLEFGTFTGFTAHILAQLIVPTKKHLVLFDSWEGFPAMVGNDAECIEVKAGTWKQGDCAIPADMSVEIVKKLDAIIPGRVSAVKGFYQDTLPHNLPKKAAVVHIDCDLYESTYFVLRQLVENDTLADGAVIMFDEFNSNKASNKFAERKALNDSGLKLEKWFTYGSSGFAFLYKKDEQ